MAEEIVETYNLFLNSDDAKNDGQDYDFQLGNNTIATHGPNQYIRFTLQNFNMLKTWPNVNTNNNNMVIRINGGTQTLPLTLDSQDYADIRDLATDFAAKIRSNLNDAQAFNGLFGPGVVEAPVQSGINITSNRRMRITFPLIANMNTAPYNASPAGANELANNGTTVSAGFFDPVMIVDPENMNPAQGLFSTAPGADISILLGGYRQFANDPGVVGPTFESCFNVSFSNTAYDTTTNLVIESPYPMNRFSEPNVYLRMIPVAQCFASPVMEGPVGLATESNLNPSNILAEVPIDTEIVQYQPRKTREYFLNMYQKQISHFKIRLTDSHNRALVASAGQTTRGNRSFTMVVRVDLIGAAAHGETKHPAAPHIPHKYPARFDGKVLTWQKDNLKTLDKPAGYS
jgi:hypothetical protein